MSQHDLNIADQYGNTFLTDLNAALSALASTSSGVTEPPNPVAGMFWVDIGTSISNDGPWVRQRNEDNTGWVKRFRFNADSDIESLIANSETKSTPDVDDTFGFIDSVTGLLAKMTFANLATWIESFFLPLSGGTLTGPLKKSIGTAIASAATLNLTGRAGGDVLHITGTATVAAVTLGAGDSVLAIADAALPLTASSTLLIDGVASGSTYTCAANDRILFIGDSGNTVRVQVIPYAGSSMAAPGTAGNLLSSTGAGWISKTLAYDSGWFSVANAQTYAKTHNLGTKNLQVTVLYSADASTVFSQVFNSAHSSSHLYTAGCVITDITTSTLNVRTGNLDITGFQAYPNTDTTSWGGVDHYTAGVITSGYYRVLARAIN